MTSVENLAHDDFPIYFNDPAGVIRNSSEHAFNCLIGRDALFRSAPSAATTSLDKQPSPSSLGMGREWVLRSPLWLKLRQALELPGGFLLLLLLKH